MCGTHVVTLKVGSISHNFEQTEGVQLSPSEPIRQKFRSQKYRLVNFDSFAATMEKKKSHIHKYFVVVLPKDWKNLSEMYEIAYRLQEQKVVGAFFGFPEKNESMLQKGICFLKDLFAGSEREVPMIALAKGISENSRTPFSTLKLKVFVVSVTTAKMLLNESKNMWEVEILNFTKTFYGGADYSTALRKFACDELIDSEPCTQMSVLKIQGKLAQNDYSDLTSAEQAACFEKTMSHCTECSFPIGLEILVILFEDFKTEEHSKREWQIKFVKKFIDKIKWNEESIMLCKVHYQNTLRGIEQISVSDSHNAFARWLFFSHVFGESEVLLNFLCQHLNTSSYQEPLGVKIESWISILRELRNKYCFFLKWKHIFRISSDIDGRFSSICLMDLFNFVDEKVENPDSFSTEIRTVIVKWLAATKSSSLLLKLEDRMQNISNSFRIAFIRIFESEVLKTLKTYQLKDVLEWLGKSAVGKKIDAQNLEDLILHYELDVSSYSLDLLVTAIDAKDLIIQELFTSKLKSILSKNEDKFFEFIFKNSNHLLFDLFIDQISSLVESQVVVSSFEKGKRWFWIVLNILSKLWHFCRQYFTFSLNICFR